MCVLCFVFRFAAALSCPGCYIVSGGRREREVYTVWRRCSASRVRGRVWLALPSGSETGHAIFLRHRGTR